MPKTAAFGVQVQVGNTASPVVYTALAYVSDLNGPNLKADQADSTSHDSVNAYRTYVSTIKEGGECKWKFFFDPSNTGHTNLLAIFDSRLSNPFKLVLTQFSPTYSFSFTANVMNVGEFKFPIAGMFEADVTLKIISQPILATP